MTPESLVARAMLSAVKRKSGIAFINLDKLSYGEREDPRALGDGMKAIQLNWTNT